MTCQTVRNKILSLPDPRHLPDALREHVGGCAACLAWARDAARLEAILEQLPVPTPADARKVETLEELTRGEPIITLPAAQTRPETLGTRAIRFFERNRSLVVGLAAAVLVAVGTWWVVTQNRTGAPLVAAVPTDPFLEKLVKRDMELARAAKPEARLQILGQLAEDFSAQTQALARVVDGNGLQKLAGDFNKIVQDGLIPVARSLPVLKANDRIERKKQLDALADRLGTIAVQADKLSTEVPPDAKPAVQKVLDAALTGETTLRRGRRRRGKVTTAAERRADGSPRRSLLALLALTLLATCAWAQGAANSPAASLSAATQARLFKSNRDLIGSLVDHGVTLAKADQPLQRAEECRRTAATLAAYLGRAADDQDPDRVVELAGLMGEVVREGVVYNIDVVQKEIVAPGDPREARLATLRTDTTQQLDGLTSRIPTDGKVGDNPNVREAISTLLSLKANLK